MHLQDAYRGKVSRISHLLFCSVGILGSLSAYTLLQERIMAEPYGQKDELFRFSLFLVLCNRLTTCTTSLLISTVNRENLRPSAPLHKYAIVALSNIVATTCQYEALKHITVPVQTLGKCAKMLPVMLWGTLMLRKRYRGEQYMQAALVMAGCFIFLTSGEIRPRRGGDAGSSLYGVMLMTGYLAFDGFTSTFQDKLFKGYSMSTYNQSLYTTACAMVLSISGLVMSQQLGAALLFVQRHPEALRTIMWLSISATAGQLIIVHTIRSFGALVFATVMTTRQFVSILLSSVIFHHPLSTGQWAGATIIFGVLYYSMFKSKLLDSATIAKPDKQTAAP